MTCVASEWLNCLFIYCVVYCRWSYLDISGLLSRATGEICTSRSRNVETQSSTPHDDIPTA